MVVSSLASPATTPEDLGRPPGSRATTVAPIDVAVMLDTVDFDAKNRPMRGSIVILNGASSSGKTSVSRSLQSLWPRTLLATGIDVVISSWPADDASSTLGDASPDVDASRHTQLDPWTPRLPTFTDDFHRMMALMHRQWLQWSDEGFDVVIDHVLLDNELKRDAHDVFADAYWVGVYCDVNEAIRRESRRGDREVGFAMGTSTVVHVGLHYDQTVDTTTRAADSVARDIVEQWTASRPA